MSSDKLTEFITATDRYKKAAARRCLTEVMPMSPDFAKLVNLPGMAEAPRHVIIERMVADGSRIVPHSERTVRGSTLHIQIGVALTLPAKPGAVLAMADTGKYGITYATHLGAPEDAPAGEEAEGE